MSLQTPLYFASSNPGKVREFQDAIPEIIQLEIDLPELQSIDSHEIIREKLQVALEHLEEGTVIVEDTSLVFEAMNGLPGPFIKFYLTQLKKEGIANLVQRLESQNATAYTVIGVATKDDPEMYFFEGEVKGRIVQPRGEKDFGWGPVFEEETTGKTYGEMDIDEKQRVSQRGIALRKLVEFLKNEKDGK